MHFVALLFSRTPDIASAEASITLRGNDHRTWVDATLNAIRLPVNVLAYVSCPTFRDVYLEAVLRERRPPTWNRYRGRVIDEIYKSIHKTSRAYVQSCETKDCDLYRHLMSKQDDLIDAARSRHESSFGSIDPKPVTSEVEEFNRALGKIVRFEAEITSALLDYEIAHLQSTNPQRVFDDFFNFNTDFALRAHHQGFTVPSTPDFIFRNAIVGDIKSGEWQDFYVYTLIAYALAYEEHTGRPMNCGAILHVELPSSRLVPAHYHTRIEQLGDHHRKRFLTIRDRKLQIINDGVDPGRPDGPADCRGCGFQPKCWGVTG